MQTSENGIAFIKHSEGFVGKVYDDVGKPAIGYGHDIEGDVPQTWAANGITEAEADNLLRADLKHRYEPPVSALVPPDCTQGQFDALVDFCFNLGPGALKTMLGHGWEDVPNQIPRWINVSGQPNDGLRARRQAELEMFLG